MIVLRYLSRDVLFHTAAVSVVLLLIIFSGRFAKYLAEASVGDISGSLLFPLMFCRIPGFMELILPLSLFIGVLMSYGRLYVNGEMIVLFASGIGKLKLLFFTLVPASIVAAIVAGLSLVLTPVGVEKSIRLLDDPQAVQGLNSLVAGRFQVKGEFKSTFYAESVDARGVMHGLLLISEDVGKDSNIVTMTTAEEGQFETDLAAGAKYIELKNGARYRGVPGNLDYEVIRFKRYTELVPASDESIRKVSVIDSRSTRELIDSDDFADRAALQWRLSLPLTSLTLALVALSMSKTSPRRGRYINIIPAFLIYIVYVLSLGSVRSQIEKGVESLPGGMFTIHFLFLLIALILFFGPDYIRRLRRFRA